MKRSERLQVVTDLQARQEQDALLALAAAQQKLAETQLQLEQLQQYRGDYLERFRLRQQSGMAINQLLEFRAFADRLDQAIEAQRLAVARQEVEVLRVRKQWEEQHFRTKSLQNVCERARNEERQIEWRREQKEQDDRAARKKPW